MLRQPRNRCVRSAATKWVARAGTTAALLFLSSFGAGYAQDGGSRMYWPAATNTQMLSGDYLVVTGNASAFDPSLPFEAVTLDSYRLALSYDHFFGLAGRTSRVRVTFPAGTVRGTTLGPQPVDVDAPAKGMADITAFWSLNLSGAPVMTPAEHALYQQKTVFDVQLVARAPLGEHHDEHVLNVGSGRWMFRLGLPIIQSIGDWSPGRRTTVELIPSVSFFTSTFTSTDANPTGVPLKQDPVFKLEGHVTRDLTSDAWFSLDALYLGGGATTLDEIALTDAQSSLSMGLSAGVSIADELDLRTTWMNSFTDNDHGVNATTIRMQFTYRWNRAGGEMRRRSEAEDRRRAEDLELRVATLEDELGVGSMEEPVTEQRQSRMDSDQDGIPDLFDSCPNTPTGVVVRLDGCLVKPILDDIEFKPGSTILTEASKEALDQVADTLVLDLMHFDSGRLEIRGYTDSSGDESANIELSHRRANVVLDYLLEREPQFENYLQRIFAVGYGEEDPIAPNDTVEGRSKNRRVELVVLEN